MSRADGDRGKKVNSVPEDFQPGIFSSYHNNVWQRLPLVKINCFSHEFVALIDSGSSCNLINSSILSKAKATKLDDLNMDMNTLVGGRFKTTGRVSVKFNMKNHEFEDNFKVMEGEMSPHFQVILGVPFLTKFQFNVDFVSNNLRNVNTVIPILRDYENSVNAVHEKHSELPAFAKKKCLIPPLSEKIIEVKISKAHNFQTDNVLISPCTNHLPSSFLVSHTICKNNDTSLFVKVLNISDVEMHINKNTKLGMVQELVSSYNTQPSDFVGHVSKDEIGKLDHTDLKWDTKFDLEHLDQNLKMRVENFLKENSDVFAASVLDLPGCSSVLHEIKLQDKIPVKSRAYRVPYNLRKEMDDQINILLESEILVPANSNYSSPVMLVKKADGGYRLCADFRRLNKKLIKDTFPIPNINETIDSLAGAKYFTSLDLTSGFFQQKISEEHQHYTAITTHRGSFMFRRSPFGLSSSPNAFQRLMSLVLGDLTYLNILVYIDDICIASNDIESHFEKLKLVFDRLRQHNLKLKPSKCHFLKTEITFLGFQVLDGKITPTRKNVEVVSKFKTPKSKRDVRALIGCVGFYRKFFSDFSQRTINLTNLMKGKGKFIWNDQAQAEFEDLKQTLASIPSLNLPDMQKEFILYTDASGTALGSVLAQLDDENFPRPVAFASRKLKEVETKYCTSERELLALVWAINYFKCYLFNKKFIVYTDHAALTHALKLKDPTSRIARWMCALADFDFETKYIKGKCNSVADFLSRFVQHEISPEVPTSSMEEVNFVHHSLDSSASSVDAEPFLHEIRVAQSQDKYCQKVTMRLNKGLKTFPRNMNFFIHNDILKCKDLRKRSSRDRQPKIVLPKALVPKVFHMTHTSSVACHGGFFKTFERIRSVYFWQGMYANIKQLVASCQSCLEFRAHKPKALADLQKLPTPTGPMICVHLDISGPYKQTYNGNKFIVLYVDSFSKWPEAFPVPNITSDTIADTLAEFICRHGCPRYVVTDRGKQLLSEAIEKVYKKLDIKHTKTTAYHPSSNAKVERLHSSISGCLAHLVNELHNDWDSKLKFALLAIRSAVHASTDETPFFILTGRDIRLPYNSLMEEDKFSYDEYPSYCENIITTLQSVFHRVKNNLEAVSIKQQHYRSRIAVDKKLEIGNLVMKYTPQIKPGMCKKFSKLNSGPYRIINQYKKVNFHIQSIHDPSKTEWIHCDRISKIPNKPIFPSLIENETATPAVQDKQTPLDSSPHPILFCDPLEEFRLRKANKRSLRHESFGKGRIRVSSNKYVSHSTAIQHDYFLRSCTKS